MNIKKRKRLIQYSAVLVVCGVFLSPLVFAAGIEQACVRSRGGVFDMLYAAQSLFSWIRVVLANLVGKLMTNVFVYGEFLNLDVFLWKVWQISRNIANFAI